MRNFKDKKRYWQGDYLVNASFIEKQFALVKELDLLIWRVDRRLLEKIFENLNLEERFEQKVKADDIENFLKVRYNWSSLEFQKNRDIVYLLLKK